MATIDEMKIDIIDEIEIKFTYEIRMYETVSTQGFDSSISGYIMDISKVEENEDGDILSDEKVGCIHGLLLLDDFSYNSSYEVLDDISGEYEAMAKCLQDIEEDDNYCERLLGNNGYLLINGIYFESKYERSGVEQSAIKTLVRKLGNATHGTIVFPVKEIHEETKEIPEIHYDFSPYAIAYIQKIFKDVGFEPIPTTKYFMVWSCLKNKKLDKTPLLSQFKDTGKRFRIDKNSPIYVPEIPKLDATNTVMFNDFSNDLVYVMAKKLNISPESVVRNFLTDEQRQSSALIKYAESVRVNPIDIIRRDRSLKK
jgi:hypothetical protein